MDRGIFVDIEVIVTKMFIIFNMFITTNMVITTKMFIVTNTLIATDVLMGAVTAVLCNEKENRNPQGLTSKCLRALQPRALGPCNQGR